MHYQWEFRKVGNPEFIVSILPSLPQKRYFFSLEVENALKRINRIRNGMVVALCFTGGVDSTLLAIEMKRMGIPFDAYFLNIWNINKEYLYRHGSKTLENLNVNLKTIELDRLFFYETFSLESFKEFGIELPTPIALTYLFAQIPNNQFLLVADGDLHREGRMYEKIAAEYPHPLPKEGFFLPESASSIFFERWNQKHKRVGEFAFFRSTPELIASVLTDPLFTFNYPHSSTKEMIRFHYPSISPRPKFSNWLGNAYDENKMIRAWLKKNAENWPEFLSWKEGLGTICKYDEIFFS